MNVHIAICILGFTIRIVTQVVMQIAITEIQSTVLSRLKYIIKTRLKDMLLRFSLIE